VAVSIHPIMALLQHGCLQLWPAAPPSCSAAHALCVALPPMPVGSAVCPHVLVERGVGTQLVQRVDRPTRDVLVTRSVDGDRHFAGFGAAASADYADCFVDAGAVPDAALEVRVCQLACVFKGFGGKGWDPQEETHTAVSCPEMVHACPAHLPCHSPSLPLTLQTPPLLPPRLPPPSHPSSHTLLRAAMPLPRQAADVVITGTLGLACSMTGDAMRKAVAAAKGAGRAVVVIDVNWRPVFWDDLEAARETVLQYIEQAGAWGGRCSACCSAYCSACMGSECMGCDEWDSRGKLIDRGVQLGACLPWLLCSCRRTCTQAHMHCNAAATPHAGRRPEGDG
jgi:hypothetical protein